MNGTSPGALPLPVVPGLTDLSVFARGGYATVYRATQASVGREVAVKVENRTLDTERDQRRFLREARAAGRMSSHPHVVDLFDAGVTADRHPYLIMELCDGSYAERMKSSPLSAAEARDVGVKIADALADAHQLGVLHRDVKPANILYSRFNEPALADFGLAVLAEVRDSSVTLEVLTPAYAAPEMFRHSEPSPGVDVYALSATLYAIMRGKPPRWREDRDPSLVTLMEMFSERIPDLPGVPPAFLDLLRHGMANDPADRPSAEELRDRLAALPADGFGPARPISGAPTSGASASGGPVSGAPVSGAPVSGGATPSRPVSGGPSVYVSRSYASPAPAQPSADDHPTVPGSRRGRRRWWLGGFGMVALIAIGGLTTWYAASRPDTDPIGAPTPVPTASVRLGGGQALPGCLIPLPAEGRCPDELECFDEAAAEQVPCAGPHTWETFAVGEAPVALTAVDRPTLRADPTVRQVCGRSSFMAATTLMSTEGWTLDVRPPDKTALAAGDRTYRCLASRGPDALEKPTLTG
ncbi:serine/threonine-protein kinase [Asanoa sp. WMMD1127]|uniref:serine/threonine-protein kinase n=1 Tax=Asanoa sp. WMMD1127 TaxID=3016107 RepID=UPI0024167EFB|nr:serine/threonine-protein kinase [Asanoa sp. WMMD1127]MDG4822381.1 serine/threonine-protein kinase [Asanoa sp. WMMD1127]